MPLHDDQRVYTEQVFVANWPSNEGTMHHIGRYRRSAEYLVNAKLYPPSGQWLMQNLETLELVQRPASRFVLVDSVDRVEEFGEVFRCLG